VSHKNGSMTFIIHPDQICQILRHFSSEIHSKTSSSGNA